MARAYELPLCTSLPVTTPACIVGVAKIYLFSEIPLNPCLVLRTSLCIGYSFRHQPELLHEIVLSL